MFRNTQPGSRNPFCPSTRTWTVSMAARPPGSASNSIPSSPSTAAASHDLACSSEFSSSILSLSAVALSVTLSASSTGAAVRFSLEQPAMRSFGPASHQSFNQQFSFDSGGVAWRRLQVGVVLRVLRCPYTVWRWARPCQLHRLELLGDRRSSSGQYSPFCFQSSLSTAAALRDLACSSELNPSILRSPLHRMAQSETLSSSSTVAAEQSSL